MKDSSIKADINFYIFIYFYKNLHFIQFAILHSRNKAMFVDDVGIFFVNMHIMKINLFNYLMFYSFRTSQVIPLCHLFSVEITHQKVFNFHCIFEII